MTAVNVIESITCAKCGAVHDPRRCQGHSKRQGGKQCIAWPIEGGRVCVTHGGRAPQVKAKAARVAAEQKLLAAIGKLDIQAVDNPVRELQLLAGEARAWKEVLSDKVAELTSMRYSTDGGEAIRGEILLFERALDRCGQLLGMIAKLNIDERVVRISERQVELVLSALQRSLDDVGFLGEPKQRVMAGVAQYLRPSPN